MLCILKSVFNHLFKKTIMQFKLLSTVLLGTAIIFSSCDKDNTNTPTPKDINTATKVSVDRFSAAAGALMVRTATNGLPAANAPINFDNGPFITLGLDRTGAQVRYYNFDVHSTTPAPIYVFFKPGATAPMSGQNNIIGTIPGDAGYNDFWIVKKVNVPDTYVGNTITSETAVLSAGYTIESTNIIVNCPVVPFGSTAARSKTAGTPSALTLGWYKDQAVAYFNFDEAAITAVSGRVPISPIYVMFNDNAAGPSSGFKTEAVNTMLTHNVLETIPGDATYSPLWNVFVINNMNFNGVTNLTTAKSFTSTAAGATVNCPVVR
jgi:hypothetical protein